jgi:ABC-type transport system involved in multi-copper enzyme maturation permease subunit
MTGIFKISLITIRDELAYKSFYLFAIICMLFIFALRGCFTSSMVVNGQQLSSATVGWQTSIAAFHIIGICGLLIAALLSMRSYRKDCDNGSVVAILSKPLSRIEYVAGKILGLWIIAYGFTFLLHFSVYILMLLNTGGRIPFYLPASLILSINILFMIITVYLLSLVLSETVAVLSAIAICAVSFISDGLFAITQTGSAWRIAWPKIGALQFYVVSLIKGENFNSIGPINPIINIGLYLLIITGLLFWRFSKEEIR